MAPLHDDTFSNVVGVDAAHMLKELENNNSFFDDVVDMLPAKLYIAGNTGDEAYNPKYKKGQHKESKEARRARNKESKLAKYDPNRAETTLQAKKRKSEEAQEEDDVALSTSSSDEKAGEETMKDDVVVDSDAVAARRREEDEKLYATLDFTGMSRVEILRTKLRAKIAARRAERPTADSRTVSKRAARRAEKQKRVEAAKQRGGHSHGTKAGASSSSIKVPLNDATRKNRGGDDDDAVRRDLEGVDFGGIAGLSKRAYHEDNRALANANRKKSLDRLLKEAEDKRERLRALRASDDDTDREKAKKIVWSDTLREADGVKNVDADPAAIKRAMRQKARKKAKSAKAWSDRSHQSRNASVERQRIRDGNLDRRKKGGATGANLSRKRIVDEDADGGKKRRRAGPHADKTRAGFEGKKKGFITKDD